VLCLVGCLEGFSFATETVLAEDLPTFILPGLDIKEVGGQGVVLGASSVVVVGIRVSGG
jgi:hypothetical protein